MLLFIYSYKISNNSSCLFLNLKMAKKLKMLLKVKHFRSKYLICTQNKMKSHNLPFIFFKLTPDKNAHC